MGLNQYVAKNIRALRMRKGLSQQDLARRTGLQVRYISRIENTAPNITLHMLERIAEGLGCQVHDLIGNRASPSDEEMKDLL